MHPVIILYKQTKKARNKYLCSLKRMKIRHITLIKRNSVSFNKKTDKTVSNIKLILAYLKKHEELKLIYNSYKELLQLILMYRKKFQYLTHLSKPLISNDDMDILVNQQKRIMKDVDKLNGLIPDMTSFT